MNDKVDTMFTYGVKVFQTIAIWIIAFAMVLMFFTLDGIEDRLKEQNAYWEKSYSADEKYLTEMEK